MSCSIALDFSVSVLVGLGRPNYVNCLATTPDLFEHCVILSSRISRKAITYISSSPILYDTYQSHFSPFVPPRKYEFAKLPIVRLCPSDQRKPRVLLPSCKVYSGANQSSIVHLALPIPEAPQLLANLHDFMLTVTSLNE